MLGFRNVLCLSPHPDDIEFSMGGTILKYGGTKFKSIVFSTGSINDPVSNEIRWEECRQYWEGISNITQHFLAPLLNNYSEEEWLNLLEKDFPLKNYDAIFLPPLLDTHYEHRLVHNIGMAMTRATPASIIEYKSASVMDSWVPNLLIETERVASEKIQKMTKFESQRKRYFKPDFMQAFHTHLSSLKRGIRVSEQFRIVTLYNI